MFDILVSKTAKRLLSGPIIVILLFSLAGSACADDRPVLYRAETVGESRMLTAPSAQGETVTYVKKGQRVEILEVEPNFVLVRVDHREGYLYRSRVKNVKALDPVNTPPYGVIPYRYMAVVADEACIHTQPSESSEQLLTLQRDAKLAIIGFENGWGKLLFKRQYGWVDSRHLKDIVTVKSAVAESGLPAPLAVYTSYYKTTDTEANQGRMLNIRTACDKLSSIILEPGQKFDFNQDIGPYNEENGYHIAPVLADGKLRLNYGGGTCQVSSTLYNVLLQLPGITIIKRRAHGANGASYLPHGVDAAVGNSALNLIYRNDYDFPVRIEASAQDGALYISMWKADELQAELQSYRLQARAANKATASTSVSEVATEPVQVIEDSRSDLIQLPEPEPEVEPEEPVLIFVFH